MTTEITQTNGSVVTVELKRNPRFRSISDGVLGEPERGFPESITDSSQYESIQSVEARCMRGEVMLMKHPFFDFDGDLSDDQINQALDVEEPDYGELTYFDELAEKLYEELPTGNKPESDKNVEKSEQAPLPVDNSEASTEA